jgi:flagellar biosynthetic protein FliP
MRSGPALAPVLWLVAAACCVAEPAVPVAPSPEAVTVEKVRPAGLTVDAERGGRLAPLPLSPGRESQATAAAQAPAPRRTAPDWKLLAALGAAFAALAAFKVFATRRTASLPPDVFEVLGEAPLAGGHGVRVVRFGPKTLLVGVSSAGCQTLAELTDPQATDCIAAACRGSHPSLRPGGKRRPAVPPRAAGAVVLALLLAAASPLRAEDAAANAPAELPPASVRAVPIDAGRPAAPTADAGFARLLGAIAPETMLPSAVLFGVMSLAPAVLLMTTCFVRMSVVLSLVRQGLGAPQIPSNQIVASLAIFLSAMVMWPVWTQAWRDGVEPYRQGTLAAPAAFDRGSLPIRRWMAAQIEQAGNRDTMLLFLARHPAGPRQAATYDDVPVETLLPAFLVSELETSFAIGFRFLLPFLVLDILVATLVVSTGLVMLPPSLVSLPLKLLVFVAADGWTLVIQSLLDGVRATAS